MRATPLTLLSHASPICFRTAAMFCRAQLLPGVDRRLLALDTVSVLQGGPAALALVPFAAGPTGPLGPHVLAHPPKEYANIAGKNIFTGPSRFLVERDGPAVDVTRFVHLTSITSDFAPRSSGCSASTTVASGSSPACHRSIRSRTSPSSTLESAPRH